MKPLDDQSKSGEWSGSDSRIWVAHRAKEQDEVFAYIRPAEAELLITDHLMLLADLGGIYVLTPDPAEMGLRLYATARIHTFVEVGIVSKHQLNIMSRMIVGEDMYQGDAWECLEIDDLDFDYEDS